MVVMARRRSKPEEQETQRTCVGCRRRAAPAEMARLSLTLDGTLHVGRTAPGRGAWVCSPTCFDDAVRRNAFDRALRRPVSKPELQVLRAKLFANQ
jgi:predicted RNA-binding protein YlxR (DUF448 family)